MLVAWLDGSLFPSHRRLAGALWCLYTPDCARSRPVSKADIPWQPRHIACTDRSTPWHGLCVCVHGGLTRALRNSTSPPKGDRDPYVSLMNVRPCSDGRRMIDN